MNSFFFTSILIIGFSLFEYSSFSSLIFSNRSFLSLQSFIVTAFCIFLSTKPCFFKSCFTTCGDIFIPFDSKAFEIPLRLRFVHFISASIGLPAVWWFKISKKTSSIFSSVSIIFFLPPTSFSDPFFWYIYTISDLINSSHDSLEMASKHATYIPVSYTHLRAHETRHDLVCRLLLEKKKKNKYKRKKKMKKHNKKKSKIIITKGK